MSRYVWSFGGGAADGGADMRAVLGGKGANLAEMSRLGLPVPPGFTISTEVCGCYNENGGAFPPGLDDEVAAALRAVEEHVGARFGDADNPLLLSVRSGARESMPGMMDTVLDLGLNDATVEGLARGGGRAFRAGLLPSLHPDVRRCRAGGSTTARSRTFSSSARTPAGCASTPNLRRRTGAPSSRRSRRKRARLWGKSSRRTLVASCGPPSARCSRAGVTRAPKPGGDSTTSPPIGALP